MVEQKGSKSIWKFFYTRDRIQVIGTWYVVAIKCIDMKVYENMCNSFPLTNIQNGSHNLHFDSTWNYTFSMSAHASSNRIRHFSMSQHYVFQALLSTNLFQINLFSPFLTVFSQIQIGIYYKLCNTQQNLELKYYNFVTSSKN